ncbi:50S ribosomal protein L15 [Candidatus Woesearchaeota archaeon]|nr:50S ribosomal protein L15 [Candidatus Woesearchaeota archaeon]
MVTNKRRKNSRQRASTTHGWGSMKKHRGAGNRGGKGMAGTGKRGDAKKPRIWKNKKYFGKFGFKKKNIPQKINAVNLAYLEEKLEKLLSKKLIEQQGDLYIIDVAKLGFNKVLGYGKPTKKYKITSPKFSKDAVEKIKAAGGEAIELNKEATPAEEPIAEEATEAKESASEENKK